MSEPGVSIEQLLSRLRHKGVPLPLEMATFVVLEASEALLVRRTPAVLTAGDIHVDEEGEVLVVAGVEAPGSDEQVSAALLDLLAALLVAAASGVPRPLLDLVRGAGDAPSLEALRDELEASLVPLNRAATRRVLARLVREANRSGDRSSLPREPLEDEVDAEFDRLFGLEPRAAPSVPSAASHGDARVHPMHGAPWPPAADEPAHLEVAPAEDHGPHPLYGGVPVPAPSARRTRRGRLWLAGGLGVVAAGLVAASYAAWQRAETAADAPEPPHAPSVSRDSTRAEAAAGSKGTLEVDSTPHRAQVWVKVGQGPQRLAGLPLGVAHEFAVIEPGHQPSRIVVPGEQAAWQRSAQGPRFHWDVRPAPRSGAAEPLRFGPTRLPERPGTPSSETGTLVVEGISADAAIYQLVGFTPGVRVSNLPVQQPVELLLYVRGHEVARTRVEPSAWKPDADGYRAQLDVALSS